MVEFNETPYPAAIQFNRIEPIRPFFTATVKIQAQLVPDGRCRHLPKKRQAPLGKGVSYLDPIGNSRKTDLETVPFKPRADCIFLGSAWASGGHPVELIDVAFGVGPMRKSLLVYGDRAWVRGADGHLTIEGPAPFVEMPLRSEFAHGGLTGAYNKHGRGFGPPPVEASGRLPIANIVDPTHPLPRWDEDSPPAGFGVLSPEFPPRRGLMGTYDQAWAYSRKPLPPKDFDPAFFNGARADQQIDGYLRGDEVLYFKHLHPVRREFTSALPGTRIRIFAHHEAHDGSGALEFVEVLTNLDTCIVDMDAGLVTLLWRGTIHSVKENPLKHVANWLIVEEPISEPLTRRHYGHLMSQRLAERGPPDPNAGPSDAVKAEMAEIDRVGLAEIVKTLREGGAGEELIERVAAQKTVEEAMSVLTEAAQSLQATLEPLVR